MEKSEFVIQAGSQLRGRIWLEGIEGTFLGHGRVLLLERIKKYGSISQAARSMEMSFKHAKDLLDSMTRQAGRTLVVTARGGRKGGGSTLTPTGEQAIALFWHYHERFQLVMREMNEELKTVFPKDTYDL